MEDRCICCGEIIPEGRQVCPVCEAKEEAKSPCSDSRGIERNTDEYMEEIINGDYSKKRLVTRRSREQICS